MAEKKKTEVRVSVPVGEEPPENTAQDNRTEAVQQANGYEEFGGIGQELQQRLDTTTQRRSEARKSWEDALAKSASARRALAEQFKPEDTSREQRNLRHLAIGQAAGELLGALFGGISGLGSSGRGYVPRMPGMYNKTLERLNLLRNQDIQANQYYRNLLGNLSTQEAADREGMARERYREAAGDARRAEVERDYARRQQTQTQNRAGIAELTADLRDDTQQKRHAQRLKEQTNAAALKKSTTRDESDDVKYLAKMLLPKTRTTKIEGGKNPTTTIRDASSYSKPEVDAAKALAKQIIPIRNQFKLSDHAIMQLQQAMEYNPARGANWSAIGAALADGWSVDDIIMDIQMN